MPHQAMETPNRELVVFALFLLGGESRRVHTEDVAKKCFELFPHSFSWSRYPEYPDKDIARVALTDARKPQYGALVDGRAGQKRGLAARTHRDPVDDGWRLTPAGLVWVREREAALNALVDTGMVKEHRQVLLLQLKRFRQHPLFVRYAEDPNRFSPMIGEVAELMRCRVDAEQSIWDERFDKTRRQAMSAGQDDVLDFIERCRELVAREL